MFVRKVKGRSVVAGDGIFLPRWVTATEQRGRLINSLPYFVIITIGELYLSPIGLSLVSKVAPARIVSVMMGVWLATSFVGNLVSGWLGSHWNTMNKASFFLMIAGIAACAGLVILAFNRPLRAALQQP